MHSPGLRSPAAGIRGLRFRVWDFGPEVKGLGFLVRRLGFRGWGARAWVLVSEP